MISVILDSSNKTLCVALAKDNVIIDEVSYDAWQRQSELMVEELDKLMKKNNLSKEDLNEVIVSIGPGSYTGVRVALTIGKVMATILNIDAYAVSSLEAQKLKDKETICLMNARSGRSYFGVYKNNEIIEKDQIMENDDVLKYISEHKDYAITGDVSYLELESAPYNLAEGLLLSKRNENKVENVLAMKPRYMKEEYGN